MVVIIVLRVEDDAEKGEFSPLNVQDAVILYHRILYYDITNNAVFNKKMLRYRS